METILITGANSTFAKKFYNSIKEKKIKFIFLDKIKPKLSEVNNIDYFKINLENSKSIKSTIDRILKKYKKINYLVTYASLRSNKKNMEDENLDNWNKTFAVNLTSNFFLIKNIILNNIKKKEKCRIVNISSISSLLISNESPSYQISKSAINHMTRYFASQAGKKGIFINSVLPGLIIKDEHKKKYLSKKNAKYRNIVKKTHLTNRFGTIDDVNKVVNFLLFENNDFINGQSIVVDGGVSIEDQFATAHREFG
tara:strand:+ start:6925 stop:7686 length:762 start_codon:yes stop_codon:yes gene_type:complete